MSQAKLYGVSVGPGDPSLLTLKAVRVIQKCPIIATPRTSKGATVALDIVRHEVNLENKTILYLNFAMKSDPRALHDDHAAAAQEIIKYLDKGEDVAMLNLGDVSIYATYSRIKDLVEKQGYKTCRIAGVTSFCAGAAALDIDLTPSMEGMLHIIPTTWTDIDEALALPGTKVFMKAGSSLVELKDKLRSQGVYEKACMVQNCGLPNERLALSLDDADSKGGYFATVVVRP